MADLSRKKAWQQDPKLSACFALGESGQAVLEAVHSLHQVTPGIVSRLFHSEREATHVAGKRKTNWVHDPNDLACLGEDKVGSELHHSHYTPELNTIRKPNSFVGLKNLGATCYMNCMLQALFHNTAFREGLYAWQPTEGEPPSPVIRQLQLLFAYLQNGVRAFYDPTPFTAEIGLATQIQQDVQEFFKALSTYLEESFSKSSNPIVRTLVQDQFCGTMAYVTLCSSCKVPSRTNSLFYELDMTIEGVPTLEKSIENYIHSEDLTGVNQYHCSNCEGKRDAARFIDLRKLPPILNFQLMRFVFDWENETKKKVKTSIEFPELLDMTDYVGRSGSSEESDGSSYRRKTKGSAKSTSSKAADKKHTSECGDDEEPLQYQLSYVLVHRGQSAYGGHYIAFVRDEATGDWWKFNDEEAELVKDLAKALASNADEAPGVLKTTKKTSSSSASKDAIDLEAEEPVSTQKAKKSTSKKTSSKTATDTKTPNRFKSGSAYMVGYTRVGRPVAAPIVPEDVAQEVASQNATFSEIADQQKQVLKMIDEEVEQRKLQVKQLLEIGLNATPDSEDLPLLPSSSQLGGNGATRSSSRHKKAEPDVDPSLMSGEELQLWISSSLQDCQWISTEWWTSWLKGKKDCEMSDETGIANVNAGLICIHGKMDPLKIESAKRISTNAWNQLCQYVNIGPSLDKNSMCIDCVFSIIQYGCEKLASESSKESILAGLKQNVPGKSNAIEGTYWISREWMAEYSKKTVKKSSLDPTINSVIQCPHHALHPDARLRRRIPATQWLMIKKEFPAAIEFPSVLTTAPLLQAKPEKGGKKSSASVKATVAASSSQVVRSSTLPSHGLVSPMNYVVHASSQPQSGRTLSSAINLEDEDSPSTATHLHSIKITSSTYPQPKAIVSTSNIVQIGRSSVPTVKRAAPQPSVAERSSIDPKNRSDTSLTQHEDEGLYTHEHRASEFDVPDSSQSRLESIFEETRNHIMASQEQDHTKMEGVEEAVLSTTPGVSQLDSNQTSLAHTPRDSQVEDKAISSAMEVDNERVEKVRKIDVPSPTTITPSKSFLRTAGSNIYTEEEAEMCDVCPQCLKTQQDEVAARAQTAKKKTAERKKLGTLLSSVPSSIDFRDTYDYCNSPNKPGLYYFVSLQWAIQWKNYLKKDGTDDDLLFDDIGPVDNSTLYCPHGLFVTQLSRLVGDRENNDLFCIVTPDVWQTLKDLYNVERVAKLKFNGSWEEDGTYCVECMENNNLAKATQAVNFINAKIYLNFEDHRTNKRRKPAGGLVESSKSRGGKKNFVSGISFSQTVHILKMKIFEKYDIPPAEMVLITHSGTVMGNDDLTLEQFDVRSDRPLTLRHVDPMEREVYRAADERNAGFGTTVLMGGGVNGRNKAGSTSSDTSSSTSQQQQQGESGASGIFEAMDLSPSEAPSITTVAEDANRAKSEHAMEIDVPNDIKPSEEAEEAPLEEMQHRDHEEAEKSQLGRRSKEPEEDPVEESSATNGHGHRHRHHHHHHHHHHTQDQDYQEDHLDTSITSNGSTRARRSAKRVATQSTSATASPSKKSRGLIEIHEEEEDEEHQKEKREKAYAEITMTGVELGNREDRPSFPNPAKNDKLPRQAKSRNGGTENEEEVERAGPAGPALLASNSLLDMPQWKCDNCTASNMAILNQCEQCYVQAKNLWSCTSCKGVQIHPSVSVCPQCERPRPSSTPIQLSDVEDYEFETGHTKPSRRNKKRKYDDDDEDFVDEYTEAQPSVSKRARR